MREIEVVEMVIYDSHGTDVEFQAFLSKDSLADIVTNNLALFRVVEELENKHECLKKGPLRIELLKLRRSLEGAGVMRALRQTIAKEQLDVT
jgi:hypothetical protein